MPISEILDGVWAENTAVINHSNATTNVHGAGSNTIEHTGNKNQNNGYPGLNGSGLVGDAQLAANKVSGVIKFDSNRDIPHIFPKAASDNSRHSHDAEVTYSDQTLAKRKTYTFANGIKGTLRIKFDVRGSASGQSWGRIYKNGSPIGAQRNSTLENVYETFSEDITLTMNAGDTLELWSLCSFFGGPDAVKNFRIYYDNALDSVLVAGVTTS